MPAIHIRDVPAEVLAALKRRAASNHRSLQMELRLALLRLAEDSPPPPAREPMKLHFAAGDAKSSDWSREEIYGDDGR
ncbi:MAG: hypothetical protein AMXMBFR33_48140 [Candidatus Xenobia bacterium]|jgi:plasmid stability protein